jgi:hypothetical protein
MAGAASAVGGGAKVHVDVRHDAAQALHAAIKQGAAATTDRLGSDTLKLVSSKATLAAPHGASVLGGGSKLVALTTGKSADTITASPSRLTADTFSGGAAKSAVLRLGADTVSASKDLFVFKSDHASGSHVIQSFKEGTDKLVLSGYGKAEIAEALHSQKVVGGSLTLKLSDKTTITISDHTHKLSASDFIIK